MTGSWAPLPVLVAAQLAGAAALVRIVRSYPDLGTTGHRLPAAAPVCTVGGLLLAGASGRVLPARSAAVTRGT